jgi:outer membrane protein assembly factor BamA
MKKTTSLLPALFFMALIPAIAQEEDAKEKEKVKTGWSLGAIPVVAYDSDIGFKYGGLVNFYDYGDGSNYPKYDQSIYMEWSRTTKGSGINQFTYDSEKLIPGVRMLAEASYLTEKALDFYGFNGYNAHYNSTYEDHDDLANYKSRMFYRMDRNMLRLKTDFIGKLPVENLKWFGGVEFYHNKVDTVDINNLNEGKDAADMLPSIGGGLYGDFVNWGLIPTDQTDGGNTTIFKLGAIYDTRDNEANPMKGIWTELQFLAAPGFLSDDYGYTRMALTHRQYFTLVPKVLNFAYRASYQAKLSGTMPFYMLPFVFNSTPQLTRDGLGGAKTMRGILRNRVVGEDFVYANAELRWKVLRTVVLNQNFYIALAGFADAGMVTGKYELPTVVDPAAIAWLAQSDEEKLHISYGAGIHFALNDNFIVTVDYGLAADKRDGDSGMYIGLNFLF